jgi:hypothetical protein
MRYRCDPDRFAVDPVDGETIVMDLVDGRLFLLEDGAAVVWDLLAAGTRADVLLEAVQARHGAPVRDDVATFVAGLVARGLLVEVAASPGDDDADDATAVTALDLSPTLGELRLTEYDDMTSIITMDPIHDVDPSRGWPFDAASDAPA